MYLRVDPSQSALSDLFVIDMDPDFAVLSGRTNIACATGHHRNLPGATLITKQQVTCLETGGVLNTLIYKI